MPQLGELRKAREVGHKGTSKYIWNACLDCRKERWIKATREQPTSQRCRSCALKHFRQPNIGNKHPR
ncbi:MAG: hypothetical protein CMI54_02790 [Parcubacteria group bacterium]|nr:hypothetical protein [Parcubacteria group bacterium]